MKEYTRKPGLSRNTIRKLMNGETVIRGIYEYSLDRTRNEKLQRFDEALLRWNGAIEEYEYWILGSKGLYEFEVDKND
jgi:hypothetical protein